MYMHKYLLLELVYKFFFSPKSALCSIIFVLYIFLKLNSLVLVDYLDTYAETGKEYTKILKKIIKQNSLNDFDDAIILPSSKQAKDLKI